MRQTTLRTAQRANSSVKTLLNEEKDLKRVIKTDSAKLHSLTKETIETLADEQVYSLLKEMDHTADGRITTTPSHSR